MRTFLEIIVILLICVVMFYAGAYRGYIKTNNAYQDEIDKAVKCKAFTKDGRLYGIKDITPKQNHKGDI